MKSAIIVLCVAACAYAMEPTPMAAVLRNDYSLTPEGNYNFVYETENGIMGKAEGKVKVVDKDTVALEVQGVNEYTAPSGEKIQLTYVANELGYQPQGAHLPTTPAPMPIPEYIEKAIAYIAAHPYKEVSKP